jgi:hypothetical protein
MSYKLLLPILGLFVFLTFFAEEKTRIPLNKHFVPLQKSQRDTAFIKLVSPLTDGKQVQHIYDLENKLVRIVTYYFDSEKNPIKTIWEDLDASGQVYKVKERKLNDANFTIYYLRNGEKIAEFYGTDHKVIFGKRLISNEMVVTSTNIFEPGFAKSSVHYQEFLRKHLQFPVEARRKKQQGTVELAVEIKADGSIGRIEATNEREVSPILLEEAIRVISLYSDGFRPAMDFDGRPIDKWLYLPIHFKMG